MPLEVRHERGGSGNQSRKQVVVYQLHEQSEANSRQAQVCENAAANVGKDNVWKVVGIHSQLLEHLQDINFVRLVVEPAQSCTI